MDEATRAAASAAVTLAALALPELAAARTVLCYASKPEEVNTDALIDALLASGRRVAAPLDLAGPALSLIKTRECLRPGRRGVPEPGMADRVPVEFGEVDLAFVPGVAFDPSGGRLGHGGGYFDRLAGRLRKDAPVFALGFSSQVFAEVPSGEGDVPVDGLITEDGIRRFPRRRG